MNREDIIRMAQQTLPIILHEDEDGRLIEQLTAFAALVAAAEREACANVAAWILKMPENDVSAAIRARGRE